MKQRIRRISPHETGKVIGIVYAILSLFLIPFMILIALFDPNTPFASIWIVFLAPLVYAVVGYVSSALFALLYNVVAGMVGGIEIELAPSASGGAAAAPPAPDY